MTLVEVVVAMVILGMSATGVVMCIIYSQRLAYSNLCQAYAYVTAQSIIEQIISTPVSDLEDVNVTSVVIRLPKLDEGTNTTTMPVTTVPWSPETDTTTFTDIGNGPAGVLVDAAYIAETNKIRPERYMKMMVNLTRKIEKAENRVRITLRYSWAIPDRKGTNGSPVFLSDELTTIRSFAQRY